MRCALVAIAQAKIYRSEGNLPQLYRLLYAYASVVLDTMAEHGDWDDVKYAERVKREKTRTEEALAEMESLKPVIDAEAEAWRRSAPRRGAKSAVVGAAAGASSSSTKGATGGDGDTNRNTTVPKASGETLTKHSMFDGRLPSATDTATAARTAAANPSGAVVEKSTTAPAPSVGTRQENAARHAHSLLPPPPPPPPALGDGDSAAFSQSLMRNAASVDFQPKVIVQIPTTDEAATDHTRLDTRLKLYNLREKVVRGDGNCQFRAVADQLFRDQERHAECRAVVVDQLRRASEDYAPYVPEDFDAYVESMAKDTAWGDHITLQAAADAYGVRMCVISSYRDNFLVEITPKTARSARVCWISFWAEVHYNSVYPA
jgi:hypothetical protein